MSARVLVVDDDRPKVARIIALLEEAGVDRSDVDIGQTGSDARRFLSKTRYDLLILDIALPMRPENVPDRKGGMKLLEEVVERDSYKLPLSVVGLTGFAELHNQFGDTFRSRLWSLELYETCNSGWEERLKAKTRYIVKRALQKDRPAFNTDVCVIAALQTPELAALMSLDWGWTHPNSLDEVGYYYEGHFAAQDKSRTVVAAAAPRMGMVATAILTTKMISQFHPRLLVMVGICAGLKANVAIGDVLVADPAWDWQMGKYTKRGFCIAPDQIDIPTRVSERLKLLATDKKLWFDIHGSFGGAKPGNLPTIKVGPISSGSAVLADERLLGEIKKQHRNLLGAEMELYGMYAAARDCAPPQPTTFGIKSVCDYADSGKNDDFQAYSAHVSARAFAAFCERYGGDFFDA